jgi:hypothetical protein
MEKWRILLIAMALGGIGLLITTLAGTTLATCEGVGRDEDGTIRADITIVFRFTDYTLKTCEIASNICNEGITTYDDFSKLFGTTVAAYTDILKPVYPIIITGVVFFSLLSIALFRDITMRVVWLVAGVSSVLIAVAAGMMTALPEKWQSQFAMIDPNVTCQSSTGSITLFVAAFVVFFTSAGIVKWADR